MGDKAIGSSLGSDALGSHVALPCDPQHSRQRGRGRAAKVNTRAYVGSGRQTQRLPNRKASGPYYSPPCRETVSSSRTPFTDGFAKLSGLVDKRNYSPSRGLIAWLSSRSDWEGTHMVKHGVSSASVKCDDVAKACCSIRIRRSTQYHTIATLCRACQSAREQFVVQQRQSDVAGRF